MATKELPLTFAIDRQAQRTSVLPPELSLLVLDNLASPGTFILLHSITRALKAQRLGGDAAVAQRPVLLLSLSEDEAGWEGLLKKQGIQVATERTKGRFAFLDARRSLGIGSTLGHEALRALYTSIQEAVGRLDQTQPPLIVVDDSSSLVWAGVDVEDILRFHTSLRALQRKTRASLVILAHADLSLSSMSSPAVETADQDLVSSLIYNSDIVIRTKSLGRSDAGEFTVTRGPSYLDDPDLPVTRNGLTTQYRLAEASVSYVTKGLDRDFL